MRVLHCEECLSRRCVLVLVWPDERGCRVCGHAPVCQLTPSEVRACLRARAAGHAR